IVQNVVLTLPASRRTRLVTVSACRLQNGTAPSRSRQEQGCHPQQEPTTTPSTPYKTRVSAGATSRHDQDLRHRPALFQQYFVYRALEGQWPVFRRRARLGLAVVADGHDGLRTDERTVSGRGRDERRQSGRRRGRAAVEHDAGRGELRLFQRPRVRRGGE